MLFSGLHLEVLWFDEHVVEFRLRGGNGRFAAEAEFYDARDGARRLADAIRRFPASVIDSRTVEVGDLEPDGASGGVRINLRCRDAAGHPVLALHFRAEPVSDRSRPETASFSVPVEPAAIDAFAAELDQLPIEVGASATLGAVGEA